MTSWECYENKWFYMKYIRKYLSEEILLIRECNWIITLGWRKYYVHLLYPILEDWYFNKAGIGKINKETDARYAKRQQESMNWASYSSENNTKFAGRVTTECSIYSHITTFDVTNYAMHFSKNPIIICSFVESCHVVTWIALFSSLP